MPDDIVVSVVNDALRSASTRGYVLNGFPRTLAQARHPDAPEVDAVIHLDAHHVSRAGRPDHATAATAGTQTTR